MSRCFAYSQAGDRCEKDGGHDGDHAITIEWDDSEVYQPPRDALPTFRLPIDDEEPSTVQVSTARPQATRCVTCGQPEDTHGGDDNPYGCYTFVPRF